MKRTLSYLNFSNLDIKHFATHSIWALPQLSAFLGSEVPLKRNTEGLISFKETLVAIKEKIDSGKLVFPDGIPVTLEDFNGIIQVLRTSPRGDVLGKLIQSKEPGLRYCAGVPLFCAAFKEFRDVKYSEWDWTDPHRKYLLDPDFVEYSDLFGSPIEYSKETLLKIREDALYIQSGKAMGTERKPEATTTVFNVKDPEFKLYPRLYKLALTQLWIFIPHLYNKYIINNPISLDEPAEPLISTNVLVEEKPIYKKKIKTEEFDLPW